MKSAIMFLSVVFLTYPPLITHNPGEDQNEVTPTTFNGIVHVLRNSQGTIEYVTIVDDNNREVIIHSGDIDKLVNLDQTEVWVTGKLTTADEALVPIQRDVRGNKTPLGYTQLWKLLQEDPDRQTEVGLGKISVLSKLTLKVLQERLGRHYSNAKASIPSADNLHLAQVVYEDGKWFVVLDGKPGPTYKRLRLSARQRL